MYDYLIVGSGLFGAVFAYLAKQNNKTCLIIDKRAHAGGNVYCENIEGINVHKYGAHIFHTNEKWIWDFVNGFVEMNNYVNSPLALYKGQLFNLPFNMNTFYQLWGVIDPNEAQRIIADQIKDLNITYPRNLEEQALSMVGVDVYEKLIKGYTEKQWGRSAKELPSFIIKRLPLRFTYNNNYFNDKFQGIPVGGYNRLIEGLTRDIEIKLDCDYFADRPYYNGLARKVVFTGKIDEFYDYQFGELEYRSLTFRNELLPIANFQGNAVVNYTEYEVPYTRIIEHKHFEFGTQPHTVITREYPVQGYNKAMEPYYPVNDDRNNGIYNQYKSLSKQEASANVIFGGRLAEYKYYDMHQIIASAFKKAQTEFAIS